MTACCTDENSSDTDNIEVRQFMEDNKEMEKKIEMLQRRSAETAKMKQEIANLER